MSAKYHVPKPLGQVFTAIFLEEGLSGIYMSFAFWATPAFTFRFIIRQLPMMKI